MIQPYYSDSMVTLYQGKMEEILPCIELTASACVTDPPYGETALAWDRWPDGWPAFVRARTNSMWCFGSMRMFTNRWNEFKGWKLSQEIVWEKHNGSGFMNDRFKRVHELIAHFYHGPWREIHHETPRVASPNPTNRSTRRTSLTPHIFRTAPSVDVRDGTRLHRSVIAARSMQGRAIHPTEKPGVVLSLLIEYAVPPGGLVLDPFAGSASTLLIARSLGRRAIGIEANEEYCEKAARRLAEPDLFGGSA